MQTQYLSTHDLSDPDIVLAGSMIDGTGAEPRPDVALLLHLGRLDRIIPREALSPGMIQGARVLDLSGSTVMPGMIDTHAHLTFSALDSHDAVRKQVSGESDATLALRALRNGLAHLAAGVTTLRDTGGRGFVTLDVRDAIASGLAPGPRIQASGPAITTTGGHLNYLGLIADGAEALRAACIQVMDRGADYIKLCATGGIMTAESDPMRPQYDTAALAGAVAVAEERGTLVAAHSLSAEALVQCVEAGVRSIEHCLWQDEPGIFRFRPEVADVMIQKNIFAGLTFAGIAQMRFRSRVLGQSVPDDLGVWMTRLEARYGAEKEMLARGVRYVLHSDAGVRETPFGAFWLIPASACYELELTPLQAIRAITQSPAELMQISEDVGTLEPGKVADFLVYEKSPADKIRNIQSPRAVFQSGRLTVDAGSLILRTPK